MNSENGHLDHNTVLKELQSTNHHKVIVAIEELRVSGKVTDIPVLAELLHLSQNQEIKSKITDLFASLKESEAVPLIVEAIKNRKYAPELKELVACCWGNGLNYSKYLSLFVELLIENDFLVAFEAYTVIVNMTALIDQAKIDLEIDRLEQAIHAATDEKKELLREVIDFLPSLGS